MNNKQLEDLQFKIDILEERVEDEEGYLEDILEEVAEKKNLIDDLRNREMRSLAKLRKLKDELDQKKHEEMTQICKTH